MERWQIASIALVAALFLIQVGVWFPQTETINSADEPIDREVDFTVEPIFGQTDDEGRIKVIFHCQATLTGMGNPDVEWSLVKGNREIAIFEEGDASDPCGDTWYLEPGTYTLRTFKTDGIRYDQSIEIHTMDEVAGHLRFTALLIGLILLLKKED